MFLLATHFNGTGAARRKRLCTQHTTQQTLHPDTKRGRSFLRPSTYFGTCTIPFIARLPPAPRQRGMLGSGAGGTAQSQTLFDSQPRARGSSPGDIRRAVWAVTCRVAAALSGAPLPTQPGPGRDALSAAVRLFRLPVAERLVMASPCSRRRRR